MKKLVIYIIFIILLFFLIPMIFTTRFNNTKETISESYENKNVLEEIVNNVHKDENKYNYKIYGHDFY